MKSLRHELFSTVTVLAIPAAILLAFPKEAFRFRANRAPSACAVSAAFVTLTPEDEARALVAAKTAWQNDSSAGRRMRIRLPLGELPDEKDGPLLDLVSAVRPPEPPRPLGYTPSAWAPSPRAKAPSRLTPVPERRSIPAFPREELLKVN